MGLTERHWFENEDVPENYEWALEDAVYNSRTNEKPEDSTGIKHTCYPHRTYGCELDFNLQKYKEDVEKIIAMLKELKQTFPTWRLGIPYCNSCGARFSRGYKYCPDCGKVVKWE